MCTLLVSTYPIRIQFSDLKKLPGSRPLLELVTSLTQSNCGTSLVTEALREVGGKSKMDFHYKILNDKVGMIQYLERARSGNMTGSEMTSSTTTEASWSRGNRETNVRCLLEL